MFASDNRDSLDPLGSVSLGDDILNETEMEASTIPKEDIYLIEPRIHSDQNSRSKNNCASFQLRKACGHWRPYEPELFPGLIYRMLKPRVVLLVFVSGKVVLT
ncbi:hypothetical protein MXB_1351, partial [Myxobolus squamalis]